MKKSYNPITDVRSEGVDVTRRLYRAISDVVRHLDDSRGRAEVCIDLFAATLEVQRMKLREYCERLIFSDPIGYGRKGEELLWRKGYYDVVTTAKHFRKEKSSSKKTQDALYVEWAKQAAHRCLIYLGDLSRYLLDLHISWDSGIAQRYYMQALNMKHEVGMPHNQLGTIAGSKTWSIDAAYHYMRCLLCLQSFEGAEGNLKRLMEKNSQWLHQQSQWDEGKLPPQRDHIRLLVAQFLLLQDLWFFSKPPSADVQQLCHQTMRDLQHCLSYVKLAPCDSDLKDEEELLEHTKTCSESQDLAPDHISEHMLFKMVVMMLMCISRLQTGGSQQVSVAIAFLTAIFNYLVEKVIGNIQECVFIMPLPPTPPKAVTPEVNGEIEDGENGKVEAVVVENKNSNDTIVDVDDKEEKSTPKPKTKECTRRRRRRRRRRLNSSEDSDLSEGEVPYGESSNSDDDELNSDISEGIELIVDTSSEEEDEDTDESVLTGQDISKDQDKPSAEVTNGIHEEEGESKLTNCVQQNGVLQGNGDCSAESTASGTSEDVVLDGQACHRLDVVDLVGFLMEEGLLQSLKLCSDWLRGDTDVVRACSQTLRSLMSRVVCLLNLIAIDVDVLGKVIDESRVVSLSESANKIPLAEDIELRGLAILKTSHEPLDWEYPRRHQLSTKEEAVLRALKLVQFGHFLVTVPEAGVSFDEKAKTFKISQEAVTSRFAEKEKGKDILELTQTGSGDDQVCVGEPNTQSATPRGQLMHHMGQLWLRAEVRDLESRVRKRGAAFSPYLAVDCDALTYHMHLVKQLVGARRFILLIPNAVVSALDKLKREVGRARETIRWLEMQFQRGNRFLRAQRAHEQMPLPLIKYPKKKDREAWLFFQIVECCYYFSKQTGVHETHPETSLVTLLTGQRAEHAVNRGFSPTGVAKSAGINLEHIETFHAKWKASSKSHG